jgi:hypothetical protein
MSGSMRYVIGSKQKAVLDVAFPWGYYTSYNESRTVGNRTTLLVKIQDSEKVHKILLNVSLVKRTCTTPKHSQQEILASSHIAPSIVGTHPISALP